ncbi:ankyrin-1-like [Malaya genurostris]|uniref:ankyrin-1-like n=1 Tax=Malaya genurostris TaxID=325434 RepID=UPI0026F4075F|nr:ankyrin-1-like [Malaya genurostris]
MSSLYYTAEQNKWNLCCILLLNGADSNALNEEKQKKILLYAADESSSAYANQYHKLWPVVGLLSIKVPDAAHNFSEDYDYPRLLSSFFVHGHTKVIDALLGVIADEEKKKRILNKSDNSSTPLDRVNGSKELSDSDHLQAIKYLLANGATKATNNDYVSSTLLSAASQGHIATFKHMENQRHTNDFHTYIVMATSRNRLNIVKHLWNYYREFTTTDSGITALHYAAERGNLKIIKYFCNNGANVNIAARDGRTPLHYAAEAKRLDVIKYLVSKGANVNISDNDGMTVLDYASKQSSSNAVRFVSFQKNELGTIKYLITECNANFGGDAHINIATARTILNLNAADQDSQNLLHLAVQSGEALLVILLLKQGANVNAKNNDGRTPLHLALEQNLTDIARLLLQYGAMYDARDKNGKTPLDLLHLPVVLAENRIDWIEPIRIDELLNMIDSLFHSKNLMQDVKDKLLKERKLGGLWHPDVYDSKNPMIFILNARNAQGRTLLHVGADLNDFAAIECLLKFNQDYVGIRDHLHHAKDYRSMDLTAKDSRGDTPLHCAAQHGNREIVALLLKEGVGFNIENNRGYSPENLARINNHNDVVEFLQSTRDLFIAIEKNRMQEVESCISRGANIDAIDKDGKTPFQLAARKDHVEIVNILLKYGATFTVEDIQNEALDEFEEKQSINLLYAINRTFNCIQRNDPKSVIDYLQKVKLYNVDCLSAVINTRDNQGNTLLHYAVQEDYFDVIQFLLQNQAAYDVTNAQNKTPVSLALHRDIINLLEFIDRLYSDKSDASMVHDNMKLIHSLKEIEADHETLSIITNVRNTDGQTMLHTNSNNYILKFLVRNGAKINAVDKDGKTPLHFVAHKGKLELAKWLIEHGADKIAKDNYGNTVLHEAVSSGQLDLITWLVEKQGANVDTENKLGHTPISIAKQNDYRNVVNFLLESFIRYQCSSKEIKDSMEPPIKRLRTEQEGDSISFSGSSASGSGYSSGPSSTNASRRKWPVWRCTEQEEVMDKPKAVKSANWYKMAFRLLLVVGIIRIIRKLLE